MKEESKDIFLRLIYCLQSTISGAVFVASLDSMADAPLLVIITTAMVMFSLVVAVFDLYRW